jgi:hypothetical protein
VSYADFLEDVLKAERDARRVSEHAIRLKMSVMAGGHRGLAVVPDGGHGE